MATVVLAAVVAALLVLNVTESSSAKIEHRSEILDHAGHYRVDWSIDYDASRLNFTATVKTRGFVGFGISSNGGMLGADIVIGGVSPDGSPYFSDRHGVGNSQPAVDEEQNWFLTAASENETHTRLEFYRAFDTCDAQQQDLALTNDTTSFIWAYGDSDTIGYHGVPFRGGVTLQPLDPQPPPLNLSALYTYDIVHRMVMPDKDTTYWCTIHRSPRFESKHHIVGFEPQLKSDEARAHTHHYNIYRCTAPGGVDPDEYFRPYVGGEGGECFVPNPVVPSAHCQTMFYNWAVGGKMLSLPESIGYPIGETGAPVDYYMFEIHFNNPEGLAGLEFETGARVYYTDQLRVHDAGLMVVAHHTSTSLTIPPSSPSFQTVGHCDSSCTSRFIPDSGVQVFAVMLHAHLAGRKMKFRQFRGASELPWVANDEMYDFDFQQTRPLHGQVKIEPGDHLSVECTYDNTGAEAGGGVTIGGLSTKEEMCQAIFWYYPRAELRDCRSELAIEALFELFGIENATRATPYEDAVITAPEPYAGMRYTEVLNQHVEWSPALRAELQEKALRSAHVGVCMTDGGSGSGDHHVARTTYPRLEGEEYKPIRDCAVTGTATVPTPANCGVSVLSFIFSVLVMLVSSATEQILKSS